MAETQEDIDKKIAVRNLFEKRATAPRRIEKVTIPGFGDVFVKGLTSAEYDEYERSSVTEDGKTAPSRARLCRHCIVTEDGKKVFRDEHIEMLESLGSEITRPIAQKALELCGATPVQQEKIEGNFVAPRDDA